MLRNQTSPLGELSFLTGQSAMARLILERDWSRHPFGPLETWPQSLRSALSICLNSAFPTAIYWGPQLRLLYNDAWSFIPGPRHPAALGAPAKEVWSDIWHEIEPQFRQVVETGEGVAVADKMLPMARHGAPEETYWTYNFSPIRGEDGSIVGIFNSGSETTRSVLTARHMRLQLAVAEALRTANDQTEAVATALEALGRELDVACAACLEFPPGRSAAPQLLASWPADAPACEAIAVAASPVLAKGGAVRIVDAHDNDAATAGVRARLRDCHLSSALVAASADRSLMIVAASRSARDWNELQLTMLSAVLDQLVLSRERQLLSERELLIAREIDHRARNVLAVAKVVVRQTLAEGGEDAHRRVDDRLMALARTQALLARENWGSVELGALIAEEIAPFEQTNIRLDGAVVQLSPSVAQTAALTIHELVTNSVKYGALGNAGTLEVAWEVADGTLALTWSEAAAERGGSAPEVPSSGFGSTLIDRLIQVQLRGSIDRTFTASGFRCRVRFPL